MATPKKATPPRKKTKDTNKPTAKITKPSTANNKQDNNKTKNKTNNGTSAVAKSPTSKSQKSRHQNGVKATKTPTLKSKQNGKRVKEEEVVDEKEDVKSYTFPMERVKRIIREDDSDLRISSDAVFLVNKATEKFLEKFAQDAHKCCVRERKKALAYKHLSSVVGKRKRYEFLSDFVPEKIKAGDALAKRKQIQEGTS